MAGETAIQPAEARVTADRPPFSLSRLRVRRRQSGLAQGDTVSPTCNLYVLLPRLKGEIHFNDVFYLTQYSQDIVLTCSQY